MAEAIREGVVAIIHYTVREDGGKAIESSRGGSPMAYLHGKGGIVPGLERALAGKEPGDTVSVVLAPKDGYGERKGPGPQAVKKKDLGKQGASLRKGMPIRIQDSEGTPQLLWVHDIRGSRVYLDINHPLAGKTLHFDVEIVAVREATADEVAHGHAHGLDGNAHHH